MTWSRLLAAGVCALVAMAMTGPAQAAGPASVVMFGESGDYIAPGLRTYEGKKHVTFGGGASGVNIDVDGPGQQAFGFSLEFTPPSDDLLAPGNYLRAQRSSFRDDGHPGIDISGDGRGCNEDTGRFTVKDIGLGAGGQLRRLWLLFEQHCEGGPEALFGEVKIGVASRAGRVRALPSALRWPERKVGKRGTTVPLTFVARHGAALGAAHLTGAGRRSWRVTANRCKGHLAAGDRCLVFVRFKPRKRGTLHATLSLAGGGGSARVSLIGHGRGS